MERIISKKEFKKIYNTLNKVNNAVWNARVKLRGMNLITDKEANIMKDSNFIRLINSRKFIKKITKVV